MFGRLTTAKGSMFILTRYKQHNSMYYEFVFSSIEFSLLAALYLNFIVLQLTEEGLFGDTSYNVNAYQLSQFYLEARHIWSFFESPAIANKSFSKNLCIVSIAT